MRTNFEEFKRREFLGDKLLDLVISDILLSRGVSRNEVNRLLPKYTTTVFLNSLFVSLKLSIHKDDLSDRVLKKKANAVEEFLYKEFIENGYDYIFKLISNLIRD